MDCAAEPETFVLVEPNLHLLGGHWSDGVPRLADAARTRGADTLVLAPNGIAPETRERLRDSGAAVSTSEDGRRDVAAAYRRAAAALDVLHASWRRRRPRSWRPFQLTLLSRCLREAAALRHARHLPGRVVPVVLTASESLASAAALLSGVGHVRVVHDVYSRESWWLRGIERVAARSCARRVVALCTTADVRERLRQRHPRLASIQRTFTVAEPEMYLTDDERAAAREALGLGGAARVGCFVGGWWRGKDWDTVLRALAQAPAALTVVIAGSPLLPEAIERLRCTTASRILVLDRPLDSRELREVYAASDFTIVSRLAGEGRESGLVMDAARFGVSLVVSDHDPTLTGALRDVPWARLYPASDPEALAAVLRALTAEAPPRPDHGAAGSLGMTSARELLTTFAQAQPCSD
jgi:glycosyltransferase involved in cell wall biosynthesis